MKKIMSVIRYLGVIFLAILPLAVYMKFVMHIDLSESMMVNLGFGMCLAVFAEIMQYRIKK